MSYTIDQRTAALQKANETRYAICEVRMLLAVGAISLRDALYDARAGSMTAHRLLRSQRGWGDRRASQILSAVGLRETKRVSELTDRQREHILAVAG